MKHISSRDNPAVKALVKLAGTAGKRGAPVLLDGVHLCQAWLQHHGAPDQAIFDVERLSQPDIAALAALCALRNGVRPRGRDLLRYGDGPAGDGRAGGR
ncbi:hypothetical protein [Streptomyces sp. NPDC002172]